MDILFFVKTILTKPLSGWYLFKSSRYFPYTKHNDRIMEYDQFVMPICEILKQTTRSINIDIEKSLEETQMIFIESPVKGFIPPSGDSSMELCQLCYCLVRLMKPREVIETGVARGISSAYILKAMNKNDTGQLSSIDLLLPIKGSKEETGSMVSEELRARWNLIFGPSVPKMNKLRRDIKTIDIFIHDSDHHYQNQLQEYRIALDWLCDGGILISDDVSNNAFLEACEEAEIFPMILKQPKLGMIGIARKTYTPSIFPNGYSTRIMKEKVQ